MLLVLWPRYLFAGCYGNGTMDIMGEPKIQTWLKRIQQAGCTCRKITPVHILNKRNGEFLFGLFTTSVTDDEGRELLPYLLIRGDACVVVPLLKNSGTAEEKFVMVLQRRIGNGHMSLEFPAGMLDRNVDTPKAVMISELHEETGITVSEEALIPLTDKPMYTSPGLHDEAIHLYACEIDMNDAEFKSLEGRLTGSRQEGENIQVTLKSPQEAKAQATSAQVRLALFLFEEWRSAR
ncbi:MAG: NUDIX domain-containing protein [Chitinivibrionales bacterium]|nr:NUDIX domain-containing protein [Chitinivibrionales bacterium]